MWRWCKKHRQRLTRIAAAAVVLGLFLLAAFMYQRANDAIAENEANRRTKEALAQLDQFDKLADERQFYTGLIVPSGERNLQYDTPRGEAAAQQP